MEKKGFEIGFNIGQITTDQFAILPDLYWDNKEIGILHELYFGLDIDNKRIKVSKTAKFQQLENQVFLVISVACHFSINPDEWFKLQELDSSVVTIPRDFALHLATITMGTIRGVLHAKTENTIFNQLILQPLDLTKLVPEDQVFKIN